MLSVSVLVCQSSYTSQIIFRIKLRSDLDSFLYEEKAVLGTFLLVSCPFCLLQAISWIFVLPISLPTGWSRSLCMDLRSNCTTLKLPCHQYWNRTSLTCKLDVCLFSGETLPTLSHRDSSSCCEGEHSQTERTMVVLCVLGKGDWDLSGWWELG